MNVYLLILIKGEGVDKDLKKATQYLKLSADKGNDDVLEQNKIFYIHRSFLVN